MNPQLYEGWRAGDTICSYSEAPAPSGETSRLELFGAVPALGQSHVLARLGAAAALSRRGRRRATTASEAPRDSHSLSVTREQCGTLAR